MIAFTRATALLMLISASAPVSAQTQMRQPADRQLLAMAMENIGRAKCGDRPCAPATPAELARPPITDEQARLIVSTAAVSVMAEHCGLDWQRRNFQPLLLHHQKAQKMNDRQMAIVGLLHGVAMGAFGDAARRRPCTPAVKEGVAKRLLVPG